MNDGDRRDVKREDQGGERDAGGRDALLKSCGRSFETTGLGVIVALIVAFGSLVSDGTLPLAQYLIFVSLMLVSAGAMVWRIRKLTPDGLLIRERLKPGAYRVSFGGRQG